MTFDIDANGIVHVMAKDLGTGKEQSIKITASSGMSKDEIDKAVKEAEAHAADDKKKKEVAEARNEADTLVYSVEKSRCRLRLQADRDGARRISRRRSSRPRP